jgi:hypothetical protein
VNNLNEKLASVLLDCHAKDKLVTKRAKSAQEANKGDSLLSLPLLFSPPSMMLPLEVSCIGISANHPLLFFFFFF